LNKVKRELIRNFLIDFKKAATGIRGLTVWPRTENQEALLKLGLTEKNREAEILSLSVMDYCEGPSRDKVRLGEYWVFGKKIGAKEIYIKIKISQIDGQAIANCISFHEAMYPLNYSLVAKAGKKRGK
jgi:hypothetical protein